MEIKLHHIEKGTGAPLLLLNGNGESGAYFSHQMECFSKFRRVLAVDTRGHGGSPRGTAPFTIRQFADDLRAFLEELAKVRAKTLVIAGTKDIIKEAHTRLIYEHLPDARLVFIPGGHFIAGKDPGAFNQAVEGFLKEK